MVAGVECVDEHQQGQRAFLVNWRVEQCLDHLERRASALAAHRADRRNLDADELVTLTVLTGSGLEEALKNRDAGRIRMLAQLAADRLRR